MGELIRRHRPEHPLGWTGERFVSSVTGPIETEHLHRYLLARQLCRGKNILDIASGEGYGTALLAQTACCVTGVELDAETVAHASSAYVQKNLRFIEGNATEIPLPDRTFDAVISFETLEHVSDQNRFLTEAKRVLKPDGFLLLSTPDSDVYSAAGTTPNPFHVRELTAGELTAELKAVFTHVYLLRQKLIHGSTILPEPADVGPYEFTLFEQRSEDLFELQYFPVRAPYLLALASDQPLTKIQTSLYFELPPQAGIPKETAAEIVRLQKVEDAARTQIPHLRNLEAQAETQGKEVQRLQAELQKLRNLQQPNTLDEEREFAGQLVESLRRQLESAGLLARQQGLVVRKLQMDLMVETKAKLAAQEGEKKRRFQEEEIKLKRQEAEKELHVLKDRHDALAVKFQSEQVERAAAEKECRKKIQDLTAAYASLTLQRDNAITRQEKLAAELVNARDEAARQAAMREEIANLVIPVWMRKLLPSGLRSTARAMKRSLR